MDKEKILVTGGLGFIGYEVALKLLQNGYEVTVLDNLSPQVHNDIEIADKVSTLNKFDSFSFIKGDIRDYADCLRALKGQGSVIHLAAETGTGQSMYEIAKYVDVNVNGTAVLLQAIIENKLQLKRIILSSSRSVYGEGKYSCANHGYQYPLSRISTNLQAGIFDPLCAICGKQMQVEKTDENAAISPLSIYATTKRQQEELIVYAHSILNIPYTIFRYQNVYGVGQSLQNPYTGILSIFSTRVLNNKPIEIFEDGKESRDFIYVDDVVNATVAPILDGSDRNEIINVGTGIATSVYEVAKEIMDTLKMYVDLTITGKSRAGDIRHNIADITKLKENYNYRPQYSFEQGLRKFMDWAVTEPMPEDKYDTAILELKQKGLYK